MNIYSELYAELAPARQLSTGDISSEVINSLNTALSDLSD